MAFPSHLYRRVIFACSVVVVALLLVVAIGGWPASNPTTKIRVSAAASLAESIRRIAAQYQQSHPETQISLNLGGSNGLAQQVLQGAPVDIFISANQHWAGQVDAAGLSAKRFNLLSNRLVLIVPQGNPAGIARIEDLRPANGPLIAIAGSGVPAGTYAESLLTHYQLLDTLKREHRLARGADVRNTLAYVESGEAQAGFVYKTDAIASSSVEVVQEFEPSSQDEIVYPVILLRQAKDNSDANAFLRFLQGKFATQVFRDAGFQIPDVPTAKELGQ